MTIALVTGCCGFVGSQLSRALLAHGYTVLGVDTCFYNQTNVAAALSANRRFRYYNVDVRDTSILFPLLKGADVIFHLAALVGTPICSKLPEATRETNEAATVNLVKELSPNQRLLYCCTNSGYKSGDRGYCTEESPLEPLSIYGATKVAGERAVLGHHNSVSLRLATVAGLSDRPRFDLLLNDWTAKLVFDGKLSLYQPGYRRNLVDIRDVVRALLWFVEVDDRATGVYNVGHPGANLTKWELATMIAAELGLFQQAITVAGGEDADGRDYFIDNSKLLGTGFQFEFPIDRTISEVAHFCKQVGQATIARMGNYVN